MGNEDITSVFYKLLFWILNYGVTNKIEENGEIIVFMPKNKSNFYFLKL